MRTNVLNDLSNVVKKGTILAGSAAAAVDSCAAGSTTLAEYPGNHPVITQLSPRNHPLLDAIWKHVAMIFAVLVMSMANVGMAWGAAITNTLSSFANKTGTSTGGFKWSADGCSSSRLTTSSGGGVVLSMNSSDSIITELVINLGQSSSGTTLKNNLCEIKVSSDGSSYSDVNFSGGDAITNTSSTSSDLTFTNRDSVNAKGYDKTGQITISFTTGYRYVKLARLANNFIVTKIKYTADKKSSPACTAPDHVNVTGRWDRFAGETINLTATAYDGSDAEIAAANITGYQWQKLEGSTWTNISNGTVSGATTTGATAKNLQITNCGAGNSGKYRCVVSTGATCSTASATATDGSQGLGVKVFMLECYNDGTKTCSFTRTGDTQTGTATLTLAANTAYTFKFHVDNVYYGNNASINEDITNYVFCNSDNGGNCASNFTINSGLGGTFTLGIDYSTGGNSNVEGEPELSVTYPRKTIYLTPGVWNSGDAKFAFYYFRSGGSSGWTDFLTANDCGMSAEIPQWNGVKVNAVRLKNTCTSPNWDDKWNQTSDITISSNNSVVITDWGSGDSPYTYGTYATPTYTISYNAGTGGSGSKASESKTCGVDFTLPGSTFTYAGHSQDGWATADGGATAYALSGSYTTNAAQEFFPHWKCNTPTITDNGDNTVTITVPAGTTVRYTTDGTNPTSSTGTVYSSAIDIAANVTVKAIAYQSGCTDSGIASQACTYHAADPCSEPTEVANEIARFFVPCGTSTAAAWNTTADASTGGNSFTTSGFGGTGNNWYTNATSGLIYGKFQSSTYIIIKLKSGSFQAGDVVTAYFNLNSGTKTGLKLKDKDSGNSFEPTASASDVETSGTYTLKAADIENDGSIKFFRTNSSTYVNRIIVTRPACTNVSITTQPTTPVAATVGSACSITGLVAAGTSPTYQWYTCNSDGSSATAIDAAGTLSFTGYTTATLGLTPTAAGATYYKCVVSGSCGDPVTSSVVTVNASAAATLTALVSGTRYDVADMVPNGTTISGTEQTLTGLSANTKFYLVGPTAMAVKNDAKTVDGIDFANSYYFKNAATLSSNTPTDRAIKFILPGAGTLTAWVRQSAKVCLAKEGVAGTAFGSGNSETYDKYTLDVASAGTYYIYATGGSTTLYAVKFDATVACTTAPTVTAGSNSSVTSTTATVSCASGISVLGTGGCTITEYGFVIGESANPEIGGSGVTKHVVGTTYTTTGTSFSKDLTGLTAETTYYVRPYATNGYETGYGTQTSFATAAAAPAGDCITITHFSSNNNSSDGKPDSFSKYLYGYKGSVSAENALTLTSNNSNTAGQNSNVELRLDNSATLRIYANNITNATPGSFGDVVSVSFDAKLYNSGSTERTQPYTIKVGETTVGTGSVVGQKSDGYIHVTTGTFAAKDGYVDIVLGNTGSSSTNLYIDNIEICQLPCTDAGLAYASTMVNKADGDAGFTNTLTNPHGVTVSYKSSNPEVATVNGTTGAVSIVGIGATVITATSARQKVSETAYCEDEATYTLCVTATASCQLLAYGIQNAAHNDIPGVLGTITNTGAGAQDSYVKLTADDKYFSVKAKSGNFAAGDKVSVRVYNKDSSNPQTLGFKIKSTSHTAEIAKKSKGVVEYTLVAGDIESDGTIKIKRSSSNDRYDAIWVERCEACTMPTVTTHPTAASYNQGASATALTAVFDGQGKELSYQWYSNDEEDNTTGSIIAGATSTSYTPSTELVGTKYYYCVGKTACGSVATNVATITINDTHAAPTADWTGTTASPIHGGRGFDVVVAAKNSAGNAVWDGTLDATMLTASTGIDIHDIVVNNTTKTITAKYDVTPAVTNPIIFSLTLPATDTHKSATLTHTLSDISLCEGGAEEFYWSANVSSPLTANTAAKLVSKTTDTEIELSGTTSAASSTRSTDKATGIVDGTTYGFSSSDPHHTYIKLSSGDEFHFTTTITATISVQFTTRSDDESGIEIYKTSKSGTLIASKLVTGKADKFQTLTTGSVDAGTYYVVAKNKEINVGEILVVQGSGSAGTYTPTLAWSNGQADGVTVEKNEDALDFTITADRSDANALASLGTISYSSSNTSVATVNAATGQVTIADNIDFGGDEFKTTTITALLNPSGCYKRSSITYVLRVNKYVCTEAAGTIESVDRGCDGMDLTITGYEDGATVQWYKDGSPVGTNSATYNATEPGEYYAVTTKTCAVMSTNSVVLARPTATATKIVDEWYVKNGRRTPDIALVKTTNAMGFTVSPTSIGGCTFELKDDGIIYLHGTQSDGTAPSGMSAGNQEVTITATACVNASPVTITIHQQAETTKPSIAFVVDGTKNGKVTDVNTSHTTSRGLYATDLSAEFNLTACNVYWTTNEQMLRQYYSQFDAVVITDDPNTQEYPGGKAEKESATLGYVNAMGTLIDVRPILTMEAYVSRLDNWDCVKGKPLSPDPREYVLKLQCKEHAIYADLTEDGSLVRQESVDGVDYWYVTMVDKTLSPYAGSTETAEKLPALQGFDGKTNAGMLGIGTIADETLQGGIERQKEPAARMMVLGVNSKAMDALTAPGKQVIINAIKYLLQTDMESLEDCSNYFKGGTAGHERDWHTATNWTSGKVPDPTVRARILAPCEITGVAKAASIDIAVGGRTTRYQSGTRDCEGRLTINADGALILGGEIHRIESAPNFGVDNLKPTETSDLTVLADADNNGALIFDNPDGTTNATVHFYSKAYTSIEGGAKKKHWQYFGIPIHEAPIPEFFYGAYTYVWEEQNSAWARRREGSTLYEWDALAVSYGVAMDEQPTYVLYGELTSTQNHTASLSYAGTDEDKGYNLIGNSWTAPIQIANFEDADFGANVEKTVYIHNTGRKEQAGGYSPVANTSNTPGQWISVAINAPAVPGYEGVKVIPAMQAFEVHATSASTLTLNYDRLVRGVTPTELNTPMRAPRRVSSMEDVDPKTVRMLKVQVADQKTQTSAYIFLHDGFSEMYDNGWDARYSEGNGESAVLYVATPDGNMAMAALPDADGAVLGFAPGQENTYTFSFKYTGDEVLYLNDMQEETSTQINEENTYTFTYSENDMVGRFFISSQPFGVPAITTGNEHIGDEAKPHKFIKDEKIYILVHGVLYDATGKMVK